MNRWKFLWFCSNLSLKQLLFISSNDYISRRIVSLKYPNRVSRIIRYSQARWRPAWCLSVTISTQGQLEVGPVPSDGFGVPALGVGKEGGGGRSACRDGGRRGGFTRMKVHWKVTWREVVGDDRDRDVGIGGGNADLPNWRTNGRTDKRMNDEEVVGRRHHRRCTFFTVHDDATCVHFTFLFLLVMALGRSRSIASDTHRHAGAESRRVSRSRGRMPADV